MARKDKTPRRAPLHDRHEALGARFDPWKWGRDRKQLVPVDYGDTYGEHAAVRESAGVFDLSHLGQIMVHGTGTGKALNAILTNDVDRLDRPGKSQYSLLCDEDGGVVDELIVHRFTETGFELFGTAANWLDAAVRLDDHTPDEVALAVMDGTQVVLEVHGPESAEMLGAMGIPVGHPHMNMEIAPHPGWQGTWACRTDRFGQEGYQVVGLAEPGLELWDGLLESGARPCGMEAYDLLRLEMGFPVHGREIGPGVNPVEARMSWAVGWSKKAFHGKDALEAIRIAGPERRLWGLEALDDGVPMKDMAVYEGGRRVGTTTSAGYSPALDRGIALALLDPELKPGTQLETDGPEGRIPVKVVKPPFTAVPRP